MHLALVKDGYVYSIVNVDDATSFAILDPLNKAKLYDLSNGSSFQDNPAKQSLIDLAAKKNLAVRQVQAAAQTATDSADLATKLQAAIVV